MHFWNIIASKMKKKSTIRVKKSNNFLFSKRKIPISGLAYEFTHKIMHGFVGLEALNHFSKPNSLFPRLYKRSK